MAKGKRRQSSRYPPPDDSYRRTNIGFTARGYVDGSLGKHRSKRPSIHVEALPDAYVIVVQFSEDYEEEEEED